MQLAHCIQNGCVAGVTVWQLSVYVLKGVGSMTADKVATESEESGKQAPLALSQPRVAGSGSSRAFSNPWPEWQVRFSIKM